MTTETSGLTPSQTVGPYLAIGLLREPVPSALVDPLDPRAIRIRGRLFDGAGEAVPDGMIELWQANAAGRYRHEADGRDDVPLEDGFIGFGRSGTDPDGSFELVTVKPGRVPWPDGGFQAPHALLVVFARGLLKHVVTRLYFPDEPDANEADPVLAALSPSQRETLVAVPDADGLRFDIHMQGAAQTTFFAV
jgi:protocatechuate 3,4-dioxygenase, alpha subunit